MLIENFFKNHLEENDKWLIDGFSENQLENNNFCIKCLFLYIYFNYFIYKYKMS